MSREDASLDTKLEDVSLSDPYNSEFPGVSTPSRRTSLGVKIVLGLLAGLAGAVGVAQGAMVQGFVHNRGSPPQPDTMLFSPGGSAPINSSDHYVANVTGSVDISGNDPNSQIRIKAWNSLNPWIFDVNKFGIPLEVFDVSGGPGITPVAYAKNNSNSRWAFGDCQDPSGKGILFGWYSFDIKGIYPQVGNQIEAWFGRRVGDNVYLTNTRTLTADTLVGSAKDSSGSIVPLAILFDEPGIQVPLNPYVATPYDFAIDTLIHSGNQFRIITSNQGPFGRDQITLAVHINGSAPWDTVLTGAMPDRHGSDDNLALFEFLFNHALPSGQHPVVCSLFSRPGELEDVYPATLSIEDPQNPGWTLLAPVPQGMRDGSPKSIYNGGCLGALSDGRIVAVIGNKTKSAHIYNGTGWTAIGDLPLEVKVADMALVGNDLLALASNDNTSGIISSMYKFNPASNAWDLIPLSSALTVGKGLCMTGARDSAWVAAGDKMMPGAFYAISRNGTVVAKPSIPNQGTRVLRYPSDITASDSVLYLAFGNTYKFLGFNLETQSWSPKESIPAYGQPSGKKKKLREPAIAFLGGMVYATKGDGTNDFYAYDIATGKWSTLGSTPLLPGIRKTGRGMDFVAANGLLYATRGYKGQEFMVYNPGAFFDAGISESPAAHSVLLRPGALYLPVGMAADYQILDVTGKVLSAGHVDDGRVPLLTRSSTRLPSGVYVVRATPKSARVQQGGMPQGQKPVTYKVTSFN